MTKSLLSRPSLMLMAAGLIALNSPALADDRNLTGDMDRTGTEQPRAGLKMDTMQVSSDNMQEIKGVFADIVETALNEGDFGDVVTYLTKADRERIGAFNEIEAPAIDPILRRLASSWREKFREDMDFESNAMLQSVFAYSMTGTSDGKRVTVSVSAHETLPAFTLNVVNEGTIGDTWRIDAPDGLTKEEFKKRLEHQLNALEGGKASWPQDKVAVSRIIAHRLLMTLSDKGSMEM